MYLELSIKLLDSPITMYNVVLNYSSLGPNPSDGRLAIVPALPSTKQYTPFATTIMDSQQVWRHADMI